LGTILVGTLSGFIVGILAIWSFLSFGENIFESVITFIGFSIVYLSLAFGLFAFANLGEASLRIRLMRIIDQSASVLNKDEILQQYNEKVIFYKRLERLMQAKQICTNSSGNLIVNKPALIFLLKLLIALKKFLLCRESEFEKSRF
jgi:hypothetical protein